jgi:hypothetical protein
MRRFEDDKTCFPEKVQIIPERVDGKREERITG